MVVFWPRGESIRAVCEGNSPILCATEARQVNVKNFDDERQLSRSTSMGTFYCEDTSQTLTTAMPQALAHNIDIVHLRHAIHEEAYLLSLPASVQSESVATEAVRKKHHMSFVSTYI